MIIPAPLRDAVYDYVAKHRYEWFGKEDKCIVMKDKELLERFIDRDEMLGDGDEGINRFFWSHIVVQDKELLECLTDRCELLGGGDDGIGQIF